MSSVRYEIVDVEEVPDRHRPMHELVPPMEEAHQQGKAIVLDMEDYNVNTIRFHAKRVAERYNTKCHTAKRGQRFYVWFD